MSEAFFKNIGILSGVTLIFVLFLSPSTTLAQENFTTDRTSCGPYQIFSKYHSAKNFRGTIVTACEPAPSNPYTLFYKRFTPATNPFGPFDRSFSATFEADVQIIGGDYELVGASLGKMDVYLGQNLIFSSRSNTVTTRRISVSSGTYKAMVKFQAHSQYAYGELVAVPTPSNN